ncbi:sulfatase-like hydrolase/transferase [Rhodoplanes sp. Z2-YC6860]|uniref:sulfatase-like hydrolase/transferase n=1 Tax=Rhodoplanes sp. Z2-YC6860 TaxID=674703 RepID=UPI00078C00FD|nr:sulfatase-like hydrolase/transferase [Rhodoplanes sp. Z2-YC6860]AMN44147.1 sulfatase [Rhodoplanes sp. Z2-YC6860]
MSFDNPFPGGGTVAAAGRARFIAIGGIAAAHTAALGVMLWTEHGWLASLLFVLAWACLNFSFLLLLPRPGVAAALSLLLVTLLITLSHFKFTILWMVINFFDVLIVDSDTVSFLLSIFPDLKTILLIVAAVTIPLLIVLWRIDAFRVPRLVSLGGVVACSVAVTVLSLRFPEEPWEQFQGVNHVSTFVRSGVTTLHELSTKGWIDYDTATTDQLRSTVNAACHPAGKPPNIVMVLDEASFDISVAPGVKVPPNYKAHFQSLDGKTRSLVVEGSGGPTWYTEYNVLTGLSARSYGRLSYYVTRIAAGHVERGLPQALRRCGYKTITLYPAYGAFLNARRFQKTTGVEQFVDSAEMKAGDGVEPDRFYYNQALRMIENDRGDQPLFIFVYTLFNHFPWWNRLQPQLTPDWRDLGNHPEVDEYLRRQMLSARDYADFKTQLQTRFPNDRFLLLRFGDHQPGLSSKILEPGASDAVMTQRMLTYDPRYFTTYYAIDGVNYRPANLTSALGRLEAVYLPIVLQEAAGLPLDPTFAEQKKIMLRCNGLFFECANGNEARRFNRLLIDAGLIKGMVSR